MTENFKNECKNPAYANRLGKITYGEDLSINENDYLVDFEMVDDCYLDGSIIGTTIAKSIKINTLDNYELADGDVTVNTGVKYADNTTEYINLGEYTIQRETNEQTTKNGQYEGLDFFTRLDNQYMCGINDWTNITLKDIYADLCDSLGLVPKTTTFINSDLPVYGNSYTNKETYRDVLSDIAECACSWAEVDRETGNVDLVWFDTELSETFTKDDYATLTLNKKYGPVNSLAIKESQIEGENVTQQDEESIANNGETQVGILDNYFLNTEELRRQALPAIWNRIKGLTYYDCSITTDTGKPYLKRGNKIKIQNGDETYFETYVLKHTFKYDGAFHSTIESPALTNEETRIKNDYDTVKTKFRQVEVQVDKINGEIKNIIETSEGNYNNILQTINELMVSIQNTGGSNLLLNSVMFAYNNEGIPNDWEVDEEGSLEIASSPESLNAGAISGHVFTLLDKTVRQKVVVKQDSDDIPEEEKVYYTFSTKIKKDATGTCYVKIYNSNEEHVIQLNSGESSYYGDYEITKLLPKDSYYYIEFYGSADSNATFTDNMFAIGEYKTQWTQANGEIMNTQVNINLDGILVKSLVYNGDYTIMSPLEFAGYSNINGIVTKVFSLNKDTTEIKKLKVEDEIKMYPLKIVPITEGNIQGWAFVPTSEDGDY